MSSHKAALADYKSQKEFFIGIDSDGCAFDTMEVKHKDCFCPMLVKYWGLASVAKYAREVWDFVNLYSRTRGCNRFLALVRALELLAGREEVKRRGVEIPLAPGVKEWTQRQSTLGNPTLEKELAESGNPDLQRALDWSLGLNLQVEQIVKGVAPFPGLVESLEKVVEKADILVVSATPVDALEREWAEHDIDRFVRIICGQEHGSKKEHLAIAAQGKYQDGKILMLGDAPGDLEAARSVGALFYPINPGAEEDSWAGFHQEAAERFFSGSFAGDFQEKIISEFMACLPERPPWECQ
jgi:phosphoglycolate phosphatase-like HAD superfamily hydrolase